jgi:hypothetical protein
MLFFTTQSILHEGVICNDNIYSIIETVKANNLVVKMYLFYLFDNLSKILYWVGRGKFFNYSWNI